MNRHSGVASFVLVCSLILNIGLSLALMFTLGLFASKDNTSTKAIESEVLEQSSFVLSASMSDIPDVPEDTVTTVTTSETAAESTAVIVTTTTTKRTGTKTAVKTAAPTVALTTTTAAPATQASTAAPTQAPTTQPAPASSEDDGLWLDVWG